MDTAGEDWGAVEFYLTFIVDGPRVPAPVFADIVASGAQLLEHADNAVGSLPNWYVSKVLTGFSETMERQRVVLIFTSRAEGKPVLDQLVTTIEELRNTSKPAAEISQGIVRNIAGLAATVRSGAILELWVSQPFETPAFITHATARHTAELMRALSPSDVGAE